uniref:Uncharacterized protein n=1 Tax=mine drainage metagenome TaxID=410659 RepID=E6QX94_9ZZZZ
MKATLLTCDLGEKPLELIGLSAIMRDLSWVIYVLILIYHKHSK